MIKVMIADDQELIRDSLKIVLEQNGDMQVSALASDDYWMPDYSPAFEKIENPNAKVRALLLLKTRGNKKERGDTASYKTPQLYDWNLSYLKVPKE